MNRRTFIKMVGLVPLTGALGFKSPFKSTAQPSLALKTFSLEGSIGHMFDQDQLSRLVVVAGRPGMGKTSVLLNLMNDLGIKGKNECLYFSLENSKEILMKRLLAINSEVSLSSLKGGEILDGDWAFLTKSSEDLSNSEIYFDDRAGISVEEIRKECERHQRKSHGVKYVFIDYFQLIDSENKHQSNFEKSEYILKQLKQLSNDLCVTVIAAGQIPRGFESSAHRRPLPNDFKGIMDLTNVDELLILYRGYYYDKSLVKNILEVTSHKNNIQTDSNWAGSMSISTQKISDFSKNI